MYFKNFSGTVNGHMYKKHGNSVFTVAATKGQERKTQVAEMKIFRWSLEIARTDRVKNEEKETE